ncbi:MAG: DUF308 domain-containing protein [Deltaproteobacteria bacterium]|nr:DUF308 domain-containing protein [Deltaproteobacteria bacterium]
MNYRWWTIALRGIAAIVFGLLALAAPGAAFFSLVLVFGIYAIIDGILALSVGTSAVDHPRGAMIAQGLVSLVAGALALAWPGMTALVLLVVIGLWAIVAGVLEIVTAIRVRKAIRYEWLLGLEGVLSIAFGIALLLSPLAGAIVIGLWVGAYALVLGGMLVATSLRVRSYTREPAVFEPAPAAA